MATQQKRRKEREKRRARRARQGGENPPKNGAGASRKKLTGWKETVRFWVIAIFVIAFIRSFFFEPYRIPSESMEDTLLVGDFLIVSKLHYGPRTPGTLGIPLTPFYLPGLQFPQRRLPGFSEVKQGDVVVFNYPAAVDVVRGQIPNTVPIERRDPYIKRVVAVPGDTIAVVDKVLYLNGVPQSLRPTMAQHWRVTSIGDTRPSATELDDLGVQLMGDIPTPGGLATSPRQYVVTATVAEAATLAERGDVADVEPFVRPESSNDHQGLQFPPGSGSNPDQFPPMVVPQAGATVPLNAETWPGLREIITRHERHEAQAIGDSVFVIDGLPADTYTFEQDYYFAMGDSRDNSVDGRYWGFVPSDHMVGKAVFIFISMKKWLPPIPRFNRFFRSIQ